MFEKSKNLFLFICIDFYNNITTEYVPKLYNSSFSGLISLNDDIHRTVTDCFNLLSSPNPDYLIESWAALRNGTCSDAKKVGTNCDKGFTHDNHT